LSLSQASRVAALGKQVSQESGDSLKDTLVKDSHRVRVCLAVPLEASKRLRFIKVRFPADLTFFWTLANGPRPQSANEGSSGPAKAGAPHATKTFE